MLIYVALGAVVLWFLVSLGRGKAVVARREWRLVSGAVSVAAFVAAVFVGVEGRWPISIVLVVLGLWLATAARVNGSAPAAPRASTRMGEREARSILGVGPDADEAEIQAAYKRLMRMAHPDKGGTTGLASQLNAARDRLSGG